MTSRYQLLIFDWDGTLMDSVARIVSCMQHSARDCLLPIPSDDAVRDIIGLSLRVAIPRLLPGVTAEALDHFIDRYREHYLYLDPTPTPLFPGVAEQLACWHADGYRLAVATGKARAGLERVLDETGLGYLFAARRGADEALSKPDPLMLQQLLEELDVPSHQALMVGDSVHDMAMAQAISMDRVGISWGVHSAVQLQLHDPCCVVDSIDQLASFLAQQPTV